MIYLKQYVDIVAISQKLAKQLDKPASVVCEGFCNFFWSDERSDFWYYNEEQCEEILQEMIAEFLEDVSGVPNETWAGKIARETGLKLIDEPSEIHPYSWIG